MSQLPPRMPPVPADQWTDEIHDFFALLDPAATREAGTRWISLQIMANHPKLSLAWGAYNKFIMDQLDLDPKLREIAILRVGHRYNNAYEWHHHSIIGRRFGLTDQQIHAVKSGHEDPIWSELEAHVLKAVDEIIDRAETTDSTWAVLMRELGPKQLMELLYAIGTYGLIAWVFNSMRVPLED